MITKTSQPALPQPPRSRLLKMSVITRNSRNNHSTHRKNHIMVKNTSSNGILHPPSGE